MPSFPGTIVPHPAGTTASPYGYTAYVHARDGLESELALFVPGEDPVKVFWLRLRNAGTRERRCSVTVFVEWVLGDTRSRTSLNVVTDQDPVTGAMRVYNMPADVITNTQRAYNTDETQPTFYAPGTEPTGRYFAPAGGPGCNYLYDGDCGVEPLWFLGRWFGEVDISLRKSFQLPGRARFDLGVEVFNVFLAKNFPNVINPGFGFASPTFSAPLMTNHSSYWRSWACHAAMTPG